MKLIFLINVDWFFASHFLHLARRARAAGWSVTIATHMEREHGRFESEGFAVLPLPTRRGSLLPRGLSATADLVAAELRHSPGAVLHAFGLFGIIAGTLACRRARHERRVFTITGRGYAAVSPSPQARVIRLASRQFCSRMADGPSTYWLAENAADLAACDLDTAAREARTRILGGAGIDPARYSPTAMPPSPPLRCALVARMIWSKGVDTAVEAVRMARAAGTDVTLTLAGPVDQDNPRAWTAGVVRGFEATPGVRWLGRVDDINGLWANHHLAVLPSRGGEGLPKSLIEAGAAGRPVLTTNVPGCREFAAATGGWSVAADDASALATELTRIARLDDLEQRGLHARRIVLEGYTQERAWEITHEVYRLLLQPSPDQARPTN
ncbi:MAG: glycosyltransferase [Hyphomicrobiaceae bacterium]